MLFDIFRIKNNTGRLIAPVAEARDARPPTGGLCLVMVSNRPKVIVYVDGFNLYYQTLRDTPYRWLNVSHFCRLLLGDFQIEKIRYFTAKVKSQGNPDQRIRQEIYLRALSTLDDTKIHYGRFRSHKAWMPLADDPGIKVRVWKTEEKRSDVNLAVHMIADAAANQCDAAALISNDSDFSEAIRLLTNKYGKTTIIISPVKIGESEHSQPGRELRSLSTIQRKIREGALKASQFPDTIPGTSISKPRTW